MDLKTPLYEKHVQFGGKMVPFAGYLLPVQYSQGIIAEHIAVRTKAGLFDVSHMGDFLLSGHDALRNLQYLVTNDCSNLQDGQVRYSPMCNFGGGIIDDLLIYRKAADEYFIVVNASNRHKDAEWIKKNLRGNVKFSDISDSTAELALQGPESEKILRKLIAPEYIPEKYYTFKDNIDVAGCKCLISRTGYTGEDGFEFYTENRYATKLFDAIVDAGKEYGLVLCGLGARDTLRFEAAMPLYGHEMNDTLTPLESGISFAVKMEKDDFIGKKAIEAKGKPNIKRVGLKLIDRGIAREGATVFGDGKQIGHVTSGNHSPTFGYPLAMAIIDTAFSELGTIVEIDVRGRMLKAEVVKLPFYKRAK